MRFESACKQDSPRLPRIEDYVSEARQDERAALVQELIAIDCFHRRRRAQVPRPEEYLERFPALDRSWLERLLAMPDAPMPPSGTAQAAQAPRACREPTSQELSAALESHMLMLPAPLGELAKLQARFTKARDLAQELVRRGWLTRFQADQVLDGRPDRLRLGAYVLLEQLGEGGMGTVYKARHVLLERLVAIKVIRQEHVANDAAVQRFRREIRAASKLSHPHTVLAHDADVGNGSHFLVMEYVAGTDLSRIVRERGALPVSEACEYIRQAALGLDHAHRLGLVHRDIKPSNLLVQSGAEASGVVQPMVKVADLGLASVAEGGMTTAGALTRTGAVLGTPDFMAPEQALAPHRVDARADLYSLGCTLYFLLTGRVPFPDGTPLQRAMQHQTAEAERVESLRPDVPPALARLVRRLMAKRPEDRLQTAAKLARALGRVLEPPQPDSPGGRTSANRPPDLSPITINLQSGHRGTMRPPAAKPRLARFRPTMKQVCIACVACAVLLLLGLAAWRPWLDAPNGDDSRSMATARRDEPPRTSPPNHNIPPETPVSLPVPSREAALAALRELGAAITLDESQPSHPVSSIDLSGKAVHDRQLVNVLPFPEVTSLLLSNTAITGQGLARLAPLTALVDLRLEYTRITDESLESLAKMKSLQVLMLGGTQVSDAGLVQVAKISSLNRLSLHRTRVTTAGLKHLRALVNLQILMVDHLQNGDQGLAQLAGLTKLTQLYMGGCELTDAGLVSLSGFHNMTWLDLHGNSLSDAGLGVIREMPLLVYLNLASARTDGSCLASLGCQRTLEWLYLDGTGVTDESLARLAGMQKLATVGLSSTRVTNAAIRHLLRLPALKELNLAGTIVDDAALMELATSSTLEMLDVSRTRVTVDGLRTFQQARSRVTVRR